MRRHAIQFKHRGASLGLSATKIDELIRQVERGLSFGAIRSLESVSGLAAPAIGSAIGIPERTFARRKATGKLAPDESERLIRLSAIFEKAVGLFEGDVEAAMSWLTSPKKALQQNSPIDYLRTELGGREVETLIGQLEHGVFA